MTHSFKVNCSLLCYSTTAQQYDPSDRSLAKILQRLDIPARVGLLKEERRTPERWQEIVVDYESRGLSREEFCEARQLSAMTNNLALGGVISAKAQRHSLLPAAVITTG